MKKSLYTKPKLCFGVERPTKEQAKVIYKFAMANGAEHLGNENTQLVWKYFGVNIGGNTCWADFSDTYNYNILTFAEFAELAGVEVSS